MDIEQPAELLSYLRRTGRIGPGEEPRVTVLRGGVSNRTVLVERASGEAWVLKQALAKLRVQADWFSSPERIHREALGLRWLAKLAPDHITPLIFEDEQVHVLAMQAVPQPHANWKSLLLSGQVESHHVQQFGQLLRTIHHGARARGAELEPIFADRQYFESLRLEPYYGYTARQVPAAAGFLTALIADTRAHCRTLVHGDYSPKNVLIRNDGLILLDHEVIHWGDPAFDLGFGLTHFLSKAHHLPGNRGTLASAALQFWNAYYDRQDELGAVRHTCGCLLARVAGRSPLEYLTADERARQREVVLRLVAKLPGSIPALIEEFTACL